MQYGTKYIGRTQRKFRNDDDDLKQVDMMESRKSQTKIHKIEIDSFDADLDTKDISAEEEDDDDGQYIGSEQDKEWMDQVQHIDICNEQAIYDGLMKYMGIFKWQSAQL